MKVGSSESNEHTYTKQSIHYVCPGTHVRYTRNLPTYSHENGMSQQFLRSFLCHYSLKLASTGYTTVPRSRSSGSTGNTIYLYSWLPLSQLPL